MKGLEHLSREERLRELGSSSFTTKRVRGVLSICIATWWEGRKSERKRKSDSSHWYLLAGQEAIGTNENTLMKIRVLSEQKKSFFLLWGWSNRKKYSLGLSGSIQICNCWYVWRRLKGTRCLKGTNSQYPHDQEGSLSEYQSPSRVYIAKIWLSASQILHERSHHQTLFWCVCGKLAYSICPDGAEIPILRYLCMIWRLDLQDFFDAPQKVCVACGTG